jgi:hypothetical protein
MSIEEPVGTSMEAERPVTPRTAVTFDALRAVAEELRQAKTKFDTSKRPLTILPEFAPRDFWSAEELGRVKIVSGFDFDTFIDELSASRESWHQLCATAPAGLVNEVNRSYHEPIDGIAHDAGDLFGSVEETDLLISGNVQPWSLASSSLNLYSFDLKHCLIDGSLLLNDIEVKSLFRLNRVKTVLSPESRANAKETRQWLFKVGRVNSEDIAPEMLVLGSVTLDRARIGGLRINELTAYALAADGCDVEMWTEFTGMKLQEFQIQGSTFHKSWKADDQVDFGKMWADGAIFEGPADFSRAKIASLSASRAKFTQGAYFRGTLFGAAPVFHDAEFSSDTDFFGARFPTVDAGDRAALFAARGAYRALRLAMSKAKAHDDELYFYRLEQWATRKLWDFWDAPVWKSLSYAYDWISSYGTAPGKALAVQNATNPLALVSLNAAVTVHNGSLFAFSLVQGLGSLGMVTLFFLAVRNRFQRTGAS